MSAETVLPAVRARASARRGGLVAVSAVTSALVFVPLADATHGYSLLLAPALSAVFVAVLARRVDRTTAARAVVALAGLAALATLAVSVTVVVVAVVLFGL